MGLIGILAVVLWGLEYLPGITCWLVALLLLFGAVVVALDQFGLLPKGTSGRRR